MSWDPLALFDALEESVSVYDRNGVVRYVNASAERLFGRRLKELAGAVIWELFPDVVGSPFHQAFLRLVEGGPPETFEQYYPPWDRWFRNQLRAIDGRIHVVATDITDQKRAEQRLATLARASQAFAAAPDLRTLFRTIVQAVAESIGDACDLRLADDAGQRLVSRAMYHPDPEVLSLLEQLATTPLTIGEGFTSRAYLQNEPVLLPRVDQTTLLASLPDNYRDRVDWLSLHSMIAVPVRNEGRAIGVLAVGRGNTARPYTEGDLALLRDLGDRASMALARARLHEDHVTALAAERQARRAAEQAAERTARLQRLTAAFSRLSTAVDVAQVLAREGSGMLGAGATFVWLLDARAQQLDLVAHDGFTGPAVDPFLHIPRDAPVLAADALRRGEVVLLESRASRVRAYPGMGDGAAAGFHSWAAVPMGDAGRAVGVFVLSFPEPRELQAEECEFLRTIARLCLQTLERTRLYEGERAARQDAERNADHTRLLQAVTSLLSRRLLPKEVARAVLATGTAGVGGATGAIWMIGPTGDRLEMLASIGYTDDPSYRTYALDGDSPLAQAVRTGAPIYVEDGATYRSRFPGSVARLGARAPAEFAAACLPLEVEGRRLGGLVFAFGSRHHFDEEERRFFDLLANHCAQGLDRARLYEEERAASAALAETARRRDFLAQASVVLSSSLDTRDILHRLAELPVPAFADWCFVDRTEEDGSLERVGVAHADPAAAALAARLRRRYQPLSEHAGGLGSPTSRLRPHLLEEVPDALLTQVARDPEHLADLRALGARSFVWAPLLVGGRSVGAVTWATTTRRLGEADLALVEDVARRAAIVLDNARLYESTRALVRRLENIQNVTSELSRARTPAEVAATTVRHGTAAVGGRACLLYLADGAGGLVLLDGHGVEEDNFEKWRHLTPGSDMPALRVLATGEPVWVEDERGFAHESPTAYAVQKAAHRVRSYAAVPLSIGGQRQGVLVYSFPIGHRFPDDEREFLLTMARQCEQALERAQLFAGEASARAQAEAAQASAENASRAKDEFLAMLGHELRNPLAPIVTALHLMKLRGDTRSTREQQTIERQVTHLLRLVDDLLDVSRITRGKVSLKKEPIELAEAVAKAVEIASPLLEQKRHQLTIDIPRGLRLEADVVRLAQVVANLLTNAARYTDPEGYIAITAARENDVLMLTVTDNGVGIDPELLPRIFDLFVQDTRTSDRGQGGLGIGLTLIRSLVQLHGGTVTAHSPGVGRGSEFRVRLPALVGEALAPPPAPAPARRLISMRTRRVLLVDDNADAADLLADFLREAGHEVVLAHDGAQALRALETFSPEVALLDIGLPVMDGYELAARLRDRLPLRLAALTGYGQDHDRARSLTAGFHAHFVKPVAPQALLEYIDGTPPETRS